MLTLFRNHEIFPRPTPWFVAWQAARAFMTGKRTYRFVYLPSGCRSFTSDEVTLDGEIFILRQQGHIVLHTVTEAMSWQRWLFYLIES